MSDAEILARLTAIVREVVDDTSVVLALETTAPEVPGWDSMAHINIIVAVEHEFGMKFKTAWLEDAHSVGDLVGLIKAHSR